jgi:very-short-patch-repair endonuclease
LDLPLDAQVAERARRQHGLVTFAQLAELGVTEKMRRRRITSGQWTKTGRSVVRIAGTTVTWESELMASVLAAGDGAMASHRSAAVLWNLEGFRKGKPELVVPHEQRYRGSGARVHRSTDLDRVSAVVRNGIPATPPARTLLDLGAVVSPARVHVAIDDARRRELADWDDLLAILVAHARRGRDGVGTLRSILDEHFGEVAVTESGFERLVVAALLESGLPRPVLQHTVTMVGHTYRLDLAYPERRLGIELDGGTHLRREVWENDHVRQNAFILAGWTLLRFTWRDYLQRRPALVHEVWAALHRPS